MSLFGASVCLAPYLVLSSPLIVCIFSIAYQCIPLGVVFYIFCLFFLALLPFVAHPFCIVLAPCLSVVLLIFSISAFTRFYQSLFLGTFFRHIILLFYCFGIIPFPLLAGCAASWPRKAVIFPTPIGLSLPSC